MKPKRKGEIGIFYKEKIELTIFVKEIFKFYIRK